MYYISCFKRGKTTRTSLSPQQPVFATSTAAVVIRRIKTEQSLFHTNKSSFYVPSCSFASSFVSEISAGVREEEDVVIRAKAERCLLPPLSPEIQICSQILEVDKPCCVCNVRLCHPWNTHPLFIL